MSKAERRKLAYEKAKAWRESRKAKKAEEGTAAAATPSRSSPTTPRKSPAKHAAKSTPSTSKKPKWPKSKSGKQIADPKGQQRQQPVDQKDTNFDIQVCTSKEQRTSRAEVLAVTALAIVVQLVLIHHQLDLRVVVLHV